jgi:hypothetical protein
MEILKQLILSLQFAGACLSLELRAEVNANELHFSGSIFYTFTATLSSLQGVRFASRDDFLGSFPRLQYRLISLA